MDNTRCCATCLSPLHGMRPKRGRYSITRRTYCGKRCRARDRKWIRRRNA